MLCYRRGVKPFKQKLQLNSFMYPGLFNTGIANITLSVTAKEIKHELFSFLVHERSFRCNHQVSGQNR